MAVDLTLAKQHLRVDHDDEDALITQFLNAAIAWVEDYTSKLLVRDEVTQEVSCFGSYVSLFYGPNPANLTIAYTDSDDASATISDAIIHQTRAYSADAWPTSATNTPIVLTYTAGISEPPANTYEARMAAALDSAVLVHLRAQYDEWRSGEADKAAMMAVEALCRPYRSLRV